MTTELLAAAQEIKPPAFDDLILNLYLQNDDLRRRCERLRKENDECRMLIVEMRKKVAEVIHSSMDDFK